jgi:hypothetical protein
MTAIPWLISRVSSNNVTRNDAPFAALATENVASGSKDCPPATQFIPSCRFRYSPWKPPFCGLFSANRALARRGEKERGRFFRFSMRFLRRPDLWLRCWRRKARDFATRSFETAKSGVQRILEGGGATSTPLRGVRRWASTAKERPLR